MSVSVVVPAHRPERTLPFTLASLAAQSYPSHLLEVVVADDDATERGRPLDLPEVRPENTRVVPVTQSWGRAVACHTGALAADGDVLHWLDADMLVFREHLEAQLRWHHLVDHAVVIGHKLFVDPAPLLGRSPEEVARVVADGDADGLFDAADAEEHRWVEGFWQRFDDLRAAGPRAFRPHVGATASVRREVYLDAGGMDLDLKLGEDNVLGYRLAEAGAVFVAEREARSWHLGRSHSMARGGSRWPATTTRSSPTASPTCGPSAPPGAATPSLWLQVVLDVAGAAPESARVVVDAVLASTLADLTVVLVGPWGRLADERVHPLDDPWLDLRLVRAAYAGEPRVELLEALPAGRCPATFRLTLPSAGFAPAPRTLQHLVASLERTHDGLRRVHLGDRDVARLERTAAVSRAARVAASGEPLDDVLEEVAGVGDVAGEESGFLPVADVDVTGLKGFLGRAST